MEKFINESKERIETVMTRANTHDHTYPSFSRVLHLYKDVHFLRFGGVRVCLELE